MTTLHRYECIPTIGSQIAAANTGGKTSVVPGVAVSGTDTSGVEAALAAVDGADVAVLVIGQLKKKRASTVNHRVTSAGSFLVGSFLVKLIYTHWGPAWGCTVRADGWTKPN